MEGILYQPGDFIHGRFRVVGRPHHGGMGIVYFCLDSETNTPVAVKTILGKYLSDLNIRKRFIRESATWMNLGNHPHIVRCYEYSKSPTEISGYLVLELIFAVDGLPDASLRSWLKPGLPLPTRQALFFGLQVVRGMCHAVSQIPGLVHRDLKPENILVGRETLPSSKINRLRVTDFGLVALKSQQGHQHEASTGLGTHLTTNLTDAVVGTLKYMAPEQWEGSEPSTGMDIFAFGCILFEMLTGQYAISANDMLELDDFHRDKKNLVLPKGFPKPLSNLVAACLAKSPENRLDNWEELNEQLTRIIGVRNIPEIHTLGNTEVLNSSENLSNGFSYLALAASQAEIGSHRESEQFYITSLHIARKERSHSLAIEALYGLGVSYSQLGELHKAIEFHQRAIRIADKLGDEAYTSITIGSSLMQLGTIYKNLGDLSEALRYQEKALKLFEQQDHLVGIANALCALGITQKNRGELHKATIYQQRALSLCRQLMDFQLESTILLNLGILNRQLRNSKVALKFYEEASSIKKQIGDRNGEGSILLNMGNLFVESDPGTALKYFAAAVEIFQELENLPALGQTFSNAGLAYTMMGNPKEAIVSLEISLDISKETGILRQHLEALNHLSNAYRMLGDNSRAEDCLKAIQSIIEQ